VRLEAFRRREILGTVSFIAPIAEPARSGSRGQRNEPGVDVVESLLRNRPRKDDAGLVSKWPSAQRYSMMALGNRTCDCRHHRFPFLVGVHQVKLLIETRYFPTLMVMFTVTGPAGIERVVTVAGDAAARRGAAVGGNAAAASSVVNSQSAPGCSAGSTRLR
jgi:hypothetical protein